jgi:acylaminoacyl-peptidase
MPFVLLAARGYSIVAVNFRGSLGFGEAGVQALPGHIGHYDVEDCIAALDAAVAGGERAELLLVTCYLLCYLRRVGCY